MTFQAIALIVLPIFGLIATGFAAARLKLLAAEVGDGLSQFVYVIAVPVLIFRTLATADLPTTPPWGLWASYFAGVLIAWALGHWAATRLHGLTSAEAVIAGVTSAFANTVMLGIPVTLTAYGEAGAVPLFLIISIHLPMMMVIGTLLIERAVRVDGGVTTPFSPLALLKAVGLNLLQNPIVIGILAGGAVRLLGLPLGGVVTTFLDMIAAAAIPCALIGMGMALNRYGLKGRVGLVSLVGGLKLVVMPITVYVVGVYVFALPPLWVAVATVTAACPSGINAYIMANRFRVGHALASGGILATTVASVVTLWVVLLLLGTPV